MNQTSPLENLVGPGKALHKEPPDKKEIDGLIGSGNARLKDLLQSSHYRLELESRPCCTLRRKNAAFSDSLR